MAKADVSIGTVGGPCNGIIDEFAHVTELFVSLSVGSYDGHGTMPSTYHDCANVIALIIKALLPCLAKLVLYVKTVPGLLLLLLKIDLCLCEFLLYINFLLYGVLALVSNL